MLGRRWTFFSITNISEMPELTRVRKSKILSRAMMKRKNRYGHKKDLVDFLFQHRYRLPKDQNFPPSGYLHHKNHNPPTDLVLSLPSDQNGMPWTPRLLSSQKVYRFHPQKSVQPSISTQALFLVHSAIY